MAAASSVATTAHISSVDAAAAAAAAAAEGRNTHPLPVKTKSHTYVGRVETRGNLFPDGLHLEKCFDTSEYLSLSSSLIRLALDHHDLGEIRR